MGCNATIANTPRRCARHTLISAFFVFFSNPLFQIPGYGRLWLSLLVSGLGGQITMLALPLTSVV